MPANVETGIARVNGTQLYYERAGAGDTLVLVHGGGGDRRYWDGQFADLASDFDVLRYDLRGYGRSADPVEGQRYRHEDDLHALLAALDISRAHIAGYSLGCQITLDAYTVYPELFRSIIAAGPAASGYRSASSKQLFSEFGGCGWAFKRSGAQGAAAEFVNIPAFNPEHIDPDVKAQVQKIASEYSWWWATHRDSLESVTPVAVDRLHDIDVPVLVITAEHDTTACREVAQLLMQSVPSCRCLDLPGASHFMLLEKPAEINSVIRESLAATTH